MALSDLPDAFGVDHPNFNLLFPQDTILRARKIKQALGGHVIGAYSHLRGDCKIHRKKR